MQKESDIIWEALIGILIGLFALPIISSAEPGLAFEMRMLLAAVLGIASFFGIIVLRILERYNPTLHQLSRFLVIGGLNTLIDFSVLNFLIYLSGAALGFEFVLWKAASFIVANTNSYFWNKVWTFGSDRRSAKEAFRFFEVSIIGLVINVIVASLIANFTNWHEAPAVMANIGAAGGALTSLTWNFLGYKFFVFARKPKSF